MSSRLSLKEEALARKAALQRSKPPSTTTSSSSSSSQHYEAPFGSHSMYDERTSNRAAEKTHTNNNYEQMSKSQTLPAKSQNQNYQQYKRFHPVYSQPPSNSGIFTPNSTSQSQQVTPSKPMPACTNPSSLSSSSSSTSKTIKPLQLSQKDQIQNAKKEWSQQTNHGLNPTSAGQAFEERRSGLISISTPTLQTTAGRNNSRGVNYNPLLSYSTKIVNTSQRQDPTGNRYSTYVIHVTSPNTPTSASTVFPIEHRYSSFFKLQSLIVNEGWNVEARFPGKSLFGFVNGSSFTSTSSTSTSTTSNPSIYNLNGENTNTTSSSSSSITTQYSDPFTYLTSKSTTLKNTRHLQLDRWLLTLCEDLASGKFARNPKLTRGVIKFLTVSDTIEAPWERENYLIDSIFDEYDYVDDNERSKKQGTFSNKTISNPMSFSLSVEIRKACYTLQNMTSVSKGDVRSSIPLSILKSAKGLIFLTVLKAGFLLTSRLGTGLIILRHPTLQTWGPPSAIGTVGLGYGAVIGSEITNYIIILTSDEAVLPFLGSKCVNVGGEVSLSAGSVGRTLGVAGGVFNDSDGYKSTNPTNNFGNTLNQNQQYINTNNSSGSYVPKALGTGLFQTSYTYSFSKGLFVGASIESSIVTVRDDVNTRFYGRYINNKEILTANWYNNGNNYNGRGNGSNSNVRDIGRAVKAAEPLYKTLAKLCE